MTYSFLRLLENGSCVYHITPRSSKILFSGSWQRPKGKILLVKGGEELTQRLPVMMLPEYLVLLDEPTLLLRRILRFLTSQVVRTRSQCRRWTILIPALNECEWWQAREKGVRWDVFFVSFDPFYLTKNVPRLTLPWNPQTSINIQWKSASSSPSECAIQHCGSHVILECRNDRRSTFCLTRNTIISLVFASLFPMTDAPNTLTGRAILKAVHASLGLVTSSSNLLTYSQLLALSQELREASFMVNGRLRAIVFGSFIKNTLEPFQLTQVS